MVHKGPDICRKTVRHVSGLLSGLKTVGSYVILIGGSILVKLKSALADSVNMGIERGSAKVSYPHR